ncbi:MAG: AbrB/MazE/SpoVT family DNA-binding domain-containing protein [Ignavibacteria bacterium]|jgi:AbrB family looped-hinge helix DNA binding protein
MGIIKVTTKGRITIPAEIRKKLGIKPGMKVKFVEGKGVIRVKPLK